MTAFEAKKIIYETIVKEIYINPETAQSLTQAIYDNLQAAQQEAQEEEIDERRDLKAHAEGW